VGRLIGSKVGLLRIVVEGISGGGLEVEAKEGDTADDEGNLVGKLAGQSIGEVEGLPTGKAVL